jgi:3'(2'), 5'-bisphosphate nucleotidase
MSPADISGDISDADLACRLAEQTGVLLLRLRSDDRRRQTADARAHAHIASRLTAARPGDAVFSEEAADDGTRLTALRVWIVDPHDGTKEYREIDRTDWAVQIALWERGSLAAGAVALPAQGEVFSTARPPSASGRPRGERLRLVVSRTRAPTFAHDLAVGLGADLIRMGSAGAKVAAVLVGDADAYVHAGGQFEWDSAAPVAVAVAAGYHASRLDGRPLAYNQPDPRLPDLLVCRPGLAGEIIDFLH